MNEKVAKHDAQIREDRTTEQQLGIRHQIPNDGLPQYNPDLIRAVEHERTQAWREIRRKRPR